MTNTKTLTTKKNRIYLLAILPILLFTILFVAGPMIYLVVLSFQTRSESIGVLSIFTLKNYKDIWEQEVYKKIFLDSFGIAFLSTGIIGLIGYPFGYFMAKLTRRWKGRVNSLLMIPIWVSSVLRLHGWKIILRDGGIVSSIPVWLGLAQAPVVILDTYWATLIGMVYGLLPMMIFSVYSSAEKLDWTLVEASRDLGGSSFQAFRTVSLPLTMPGLLSGVVLTFIPTMGLIFIAELLGGNKPTLVGYTINLAATSGHNLPFAAALSVILLLFTTFFLMLYRRVFRVKELEGVV